MEGLYPIIRRKRKPLVETVANVKAPEEVPLVQPLITESKPDHETTPLQNLPAASRRRAR